MLAIAGFEVLAQREQICLLVDLPIDQELLN